jgi:hypothetical protein
VSSVRRHTLPSGHPYIKRCQAGRSQIALAQREWKDGEVGHARNVLTSCRSDLRGWEFDYQSALFNKSH